jgi:DnaK suppressor protein
MHTPRRHDVNAVKKTAAKKAAVTKKAATNKVAAPKAKAAKAPVARKAAMPKAKPVAKKPVAKASAKKITLAKAPAKASSIASVKPAAKPPSKAPSKAGAQIKAVAKPKAAKPVAKAPVKADAKKVSPKVASKSPVKAPAKAPAKAALKQAVKSVVKAANKAFPVAMPAVVKPAPAAPVLAPAVPRASKASARLAQITVPSMAQTVASTAAKSSYLPTMPSPVISAPLTSVKKNPKLANNWKSKPVDTLTDEEILAMPEAEYMNDVQLAFFKRKLIELKQGILDNAGETTEHLREDTAVVPDPADRATIEEEHALELRTRDRERKLLKKIEQSINLIDAGDYGYCDETGEPIGVGRLLARPTATLSLEAQQRRELKQKMFGD